MLRAKNLFDCLRLPIPQASASKARHPPIIIPAEPKSKSAIPINSGRNVKKTANRALNHN